ncbi:Uncharacterised protein [Vibrio cholerae]|nr:Uncharacterised protein [Vibrio cholerae]
MRTSKVFWTTVWLHGVKWQRSRWKSAFQCHVRLQH